MTIAAEPNDATDVEPSKLVAAEVDDEPTPAPLATAYDVFVSYRLDPDQPVAVALRRLIEGSLEPSPRVFVSGAGGLHPARIGMRPQIQKAVQSARAFVAVITPQSKEREWVIFEAGAAWGRGQFYAPLLIDTEPHELGTTIADFVATKADSRDQVERFVDALGKELGATMKSHFGPRYVAFERQLEQRKVVQGKTRNTLPLPESKGIVRALELWHADRKLESLEAFDQAKGEATTIEEKADADILRLSVQHERSDDLRTQLEMLDDEIKASASWLVWRAILERTAHRALEYLEQALSTPTISAGDRPFAVRAKAERLFDLNRVPEAIAFVMSELHSVGGRSRSGLVTLLWERCRTLGPLSKVLLGCATLSEGNAEVLAQLTEVAIEERWPGIAICTANTLRRLSDSNSAINTLGRAYHVGGYHSLAYEAYEEAAGAGASVAKANLARCLTHHPNPAAGLAVLKEHRGDFDAASPDYPFQVRAEAEKLVEAERTKAVASAKVAQRLCLILAEIADEALSSDSDELGPDQLEGIGADSQSVNFVRLPPFPTLYEVRSGDRTIGTCLIRSDEQECQGIRIDLTSDAEPTRTCWSRKTIVAGSTTNEEN
jgi:hypothetical protein